MQNFHQGACHSRKGDKCTLGASLALFPSWPLGYLLGKDSVASVGFLSRKGGVCLSGFTLVLCGQLQMDLAALGILAVVAGASLG